MKLSSSARILRFITPYGKVLHIFLIEKGRITSVLQSRINQGTYDHVPITNLVVDKPNISRGTP